MIKKALFFAELYRLLLAFFTNSTPKCMMNTTVMTAAGFRTIEVKQYLHLQNKNVYLVCSTHLSYHTASEDLKSRRPTFIV